MDRVWCLVEKIEMGTGRGRVRLLLILPALCMPTWRRCGEMKMKSRAFAPLALWPKCLSYAARRFSNTRRPPECRRSTESPCTIAFHSSCCCLHAVFFYVALAAASSFYTGGSGWCNAVRFCSKIEMVAVVVFRLRVKILSMLRVVDVITLSISIGAGDKLATAVS